MKTMTRVLAAALVALLLVPSFALAETATPSFTGATVSLSNISYSLNIATGEDDPIVAEGVIDAEALIEGAAAQNGGIVTMTVNAAGEEALKVGAIVDADAKQVYAGMNGVSDAVMVPMDALTGAAGAPQVDPEVMEQVQAMLAQLQTIIENIGTAAGTVDTEKIGNAFNNFLNENLIPAGEQLIDDTDHNLYGTYQVMEYSLTGEKVASLLTEVSGTLVENQDLISSCQALVDFISQVTGQEAFDLSAFDPEQAFAGLAEATGTVSGQIMMNAETNDIIFTFNAADVDEEGNSVDLMGGMFYTDRDEEFEYVGFDTSTYMEPMMSYRVTGVSGIETPIYSFTVTQTTESDGYNTDMTVIADVDLTEGIQLGLHQKQLTSINFGGDMEPMEMSTLTEILFDGDTYTDGAAAGIQGTLSMNMSSDSMVGMDVSASCDLKAELNDGSAVSFDLPANVIDITQADEVTMASLQSEFTEAAQAGLMKLMRLEGVQTLMSLFAAQQSEAAA